MNSAPVLRTLGSLAIAAGLAAAATPAATPTRVVPAGVSVGGIAVGGLSAEPARARIDAAFAQPVRILAAGKLLRVGPAQVGAASSVDDAVSSALDATPRSKIALPVRYSTKKIEKLVAHLAHLYDRPAVDATVTGATGSAPTFAPAKPGRAVDQRTMRAAIVGIGLVGGIFILLGRAFAATVRESGHPRLILGGLAALVCVIVLLTYLGVSLPRE